MQFGIRCVNHNLVAVAERLRRWTRNPLGSPRAGSNLAGYVLSRIETVFHSNNYDRQLLDCLAICCTCPGVAVSLIVFFNTALCSLYFCASLFSFFPTRKDPGLWISRVFSSKRKSGDCGSVANSSISSL